MSPTETGDVFDLDSVVTLAPEEGVLVAKEKSKKAQVADQIATGALASPAPKKGKAPRGGTRPDQRKPASGGAQPANRVDGPLDQLPKGVEKDIEISALTFDPDFQKRTQIFDEFTVEKYKEKYLDAIDAKAKDAKNSDPSRILGVLRAIDTGESLYVWDGFQRGEAARRAKLDTLPVIVTKGTKEDAEFFSLRANADHGLTRSSNDCRRAVVAALDNPVLFARIDAQKDVYGGLNRALSAACGVSKGLVSKVLNDRGQTIRSGKIVNLPKPREPKVEPETKGKGKDKPEPDTGPGLFDEPVAPEGLTGAALVEHLKSQSGGMSPEEHSAQIKATATKLILHEAKMLAAKLARICAGLIEREDVHLVFARHAEAAGCAIEARRKDTSEIGAFGKVVDSVEHFEAWPVLDTIVSVLEKTEAEIVPAEPKAEPVALTPEQVAPPEDQITEEEPTKGKKKSKGKSK